MVTDKVIELLERIYEDLDEFINLVGLEERYDGYVCHNKDEVDEEWCDYEMLESITLAHADIGYWLFD